MGHYPILIVPRHIRMASIKPTRFANDTTYFNAQLKTVFEIRHRSCNNLEVFAYIT
jgi:hypothetical protein